MPPEKTQKFAFYDEHYGQKGTKLFKNERLFGQFKIVNAYFILRETNESVFGN